jgi:hypothetical protein
MREGQIWMQKVDAGTHLYTVHVWRSRGAMALIEGADCVSGKDIDGNTPLHTACMVKLDMTIDDEWG